MPATSFADRDDLRASTRAFLTDTYPPLSAESRVGNREAVTQPFWNRMAVQAQLQGLMVPEEFDGQGLGMTEAVIVAEEAGRVLLDQPLVSSALLATSAVLGSGGSPLFKGLARGEIIAALVIAEEIELTQTNGDWRISGMVEPIIDGMLATHFVVVSTHGVFVVDRESVDRVALSGLDVTRSLAQLTFDRAPADLIAEPQVGLMVDVAAVFASAELVGIADAALALALDHAKQREQFGTVIGSFQAIKHLCADMFTAVESSRAAVTAAAIAADDHSTQLPELASVAKAYCSEQCPRVVESLIQILGGVGFTWEHPAHLLLRRAKTLEILFGDPEWHRQRLASVLQLGSSS